jgi:hypothetical protein
LLRVLQVKQCGTNINKIYILPYQEKMPYKRTRNTPKEHQRTTRDPPKLHFIDPRKVTKWHQKS